MEYRSLGRTGVQVSQICLGTMMFGGKTDRTESIRIIDHALDNGVNFVDTANVYAGNESERIVGEALATADKRQPAPAPPEKARPAGAKAIVWDFDNLKEIGGHKLQVLGDPKATKGHKDEARAKINKIRDTIKKRLRKKAKNDKQLKDLLDKFEKAKKKKKEEKEKELFAPIYDVPIDPC